MSPGIPTSLPNSPGNPTAVTSTEGKGRKNSGRYLGAWNQKVLSSGSSKYTCGCVARQRMTAKQLLASLLSNGDGYSSILILLLSFNSEVYSSLTQSLEEAASCDLNHGPALLQTGDNRGKTRRLLAEEGLFMLSWSSYIDNLQRVGKSINATGQLIKAVLRLIIKGPLTIPMGFPRTLWVTRFFGKPHNCCWKPDAQATCSGPHWGSAACATRVEI